MIVKNIKYTSLGYRFTPHSKISIVTQAKEIIKNGKLWGQIDAGNDTMQLQISKISHKIDDIGFVDDQIEIDIAVLDTPQGQILKAILSKGDVAPTFMINGKGKVEGNVVLYVEKLFSLDLVF